MREDFSFLKDDVYALRTEGEGYRVTKFTKDLNPVGFYHINVKDDGSITCNCPQSNRGHCKHIDIVDGYNLYPERIDKGWFYCYQTGDWFPPIEPPTAGGGEAEVPSLASPVTPEVASELEPPSLPSGVMVFNEPMKRRF